MRILIVFHGWLPAPGLAVSGGALRAWHHARALEEAGHEVHLVTRQQDRQPGGPPTFSSPGSLKAHALSVRPDVVLCVQPEEAPHLAELDSPLVVDLYAPRLLEAQFQGQAPLEAERTMEAIRSGDWFLFSNHRQKWFWLGVLALAGVDLRRDPGAVVPLVAPDPPPRRPRASPPLLVIGGVPWPWIDQEEGLRRAVAHLERRGEGKLVVYGGPPALGGASMEEPPRVLPPGPHLEYAGVLPYHDLLEAYSRATGALDLAMPTPERSLAVAFRHMDYLASGIPMVVGASHPLAAPLEDAGAGFVGLPIEEALDRLLDEPRRAGRMGAAARRLAATTFSRAVAEAPLVRWLEAPSRRERGPTLLGDLASALASARAAEAARVAMSAEVGAMKREVEVKREEVMGLVGQIHSLVTANERLSAAVAEVAGFKREAVEVLGQSGERDRQEALAQAKEVATLQADLAKKSAEIIAMEAEHRRLENDLSNTRRELSEAGKRRLFRR